MSSHQEPTAAKKADILDQVLLISESDADLSVAHVTHEHVTPLISDSRPASSSLAKTSSLEIKTPHRKNRYTGLFSLSPESAIAAALKLPNISRATADSYQTSEAIASTSQHSQQTNNISQVPAITSTRLKSDRPHIKTPAKPLYLSGESKLFQVDLSDPISTGSSSPIKLSPLKVAPETTGKTTSDNKKAQKAQKTQKCKNTNSKDLKEANKVTRNKEEILSEMVLHISLPLHDSLFDDEHLQALFKDSNVRKTYSRLPMISWTRKVKADYDTEKDIFIPCDPKEIRERILVLYYAAVECIAKIHNGNLADEIHRALEKEVSQDPSLNYHMVIVVEGYDGYVSKLKQQEGKKYQAEVRSQVNPEISASQSNKRKAQEALELPVQAEEIEGLMTSFMIANNVTIFPVKNNKDGIEWLRSFTYTIGSAYYDKYNRNMELSNLGRVKSGTDKRSTFIQSIKQFKFMTTPKAEQLFGFYPSILSMYEKYSSSDTLGTYGGKNVLPPMVDAAMKKLLTCEDPNAMIND